LVEKAAESAAAAVDISAQDAPAAVADDGAASAAAGESQLLSAVLALNLSAEQAEELLRLRWQLRAVLNGAADERARCTEAGAQ
jgi:hypothetical protein